MGRVLNGIFNLSANYEPLISAPLDARTVVEFVSDLTNSTTWSVDGSIYLYKGLMVAVVADTDENNGIYFLIDEEHYDNISNWLKIADQKAIDKLNKKIEDIEIAGGGGAMQVQNKQSLPNIGNAKLVYFVIDENATYRWDDVDLRYYCVGRNYEEIQIINGGNASAKI